MKTVAFHTLGCKVNHYESEAMMDLFKKAGYRLVDFDEEADIYIINSCTVTNEAARKSRQLARKAGRQNPRALVALIGCYSQVSPDEVRGIEGVDLILGTAHRGEIVGLIEEALAGRTPGGKILRRSELTDFEDLRLEEVLETTRAYLKIEEGCDQFCTYCIIPFARGPVRSRKEESVVAGVRRLIKLGVREIILTGTHLGAYGTEQGRGSALNSLLERVLKLPGLGRIRLSSLEVTEVDDQLLELIAAEDKLCSHLHLPLQSGSDYILEKMKRPYTTAEFRDVVEKTRELIPGIALTTDLIVGFPGEKERYFQESLQFVEEIGFSRLHVFPFSAREGTPAARMKEQLPGNIKKRYSQEMRVLNKRLMSAYQQRFLGQAGEVVVEEKRDSKSGMLTGMTDNYLRVLMDGGDKYMGKMVRVKLEASYDHENTLGKIMEEREEFSSVSRNIDRSEVR